MASPVLSLEVVGGIFREDTLDRGSIGGSEVFIGNGPENIVNGSIRRDP